MKSSVIVARHPLHPILVPIPLTSFMLALVGDLVYLATGAPFWYDFARALLGIGIVGTFLAAVPGLADYLRVVPRAGAEARDEATRHLVFNLSLVAVFIVDFVLRMSLGATSGALLWLAVALTVAGNAMLAYSGWLGGQLVYLHHIGVEEGAADRGPGLRVTLSPAEREASRASGDSE